MDDLGAQISELLGSEEGMNKLKQMAQMLGLDGGNGNGMAQNTSSPAQQGGQSQQNPLQGVDLSALSGILGGIKNNTNQPQQNTTTANGLDFLKNIDVNKLIKIGTALSNMNREDDNTRLLYALKPHLRGERAHRVDEAVGIMRVLTLLPTLRETNLLGDLFGGGEGH